MTEMFSRGALGVLTLVIAEYLFFGFAASLVGGSVVIWASLAAFLAGSLLLRRHVPALLRGSVEPLSQASRSVGGTRGSSATGSRSGTGRGAADHGLLAAAGLLLLIPGLITGLAGMALLVPPVRYWVRSRVRDRFDALLSRGFAGIGGLNVSFPNAGPYARRDVVDVEEHHDGSAQGDAVDEDIPKSAPRELD
ncbi:MAG: FxsA family protein [Actinomycetia bacterium]|nr:FxsA family protein [Actinomycetes bacterium]MCP4225692.1 FxsA family protein [Actinomycetes bacterium]MCP5030849.1 FxsA family protein [Actinomycetes bacterium]